MTHPQHEHRRHRLSRRAWRSPGWHGCSYIRRRDGQLSSHHARQHYDRLGSRFEREQAGALQIVEQASKLSTTVCFWRGEADLRQEHRAPATVFSVLAFSQVHWSADCLPQEHLASAAQTQVWGAPERPQQVVGTVMMVWEGLMDETWFGCIVGIEWSEVVLEVVFENTMNVS